MDGVASNSVASSAANDMDERDTCAVVAEEAYAVASVEVVFALVVAGHDKNYKWGHSPIQALMADDRMVDCPRGVVVVGLGAPLELIGCLVWCPWPVFWLPRAFELAVELPQCPHLAKPFSV